MLMGDSRREMLGARKDIARRRRVSMKMLLGLLVAAGAADGRRERRSGGGAAHIVTVSLPAPGLDRVAQRKALIRLASPLRERG